MIKKTAAELIINATNESILDSILRLQATGKNFTQIAKQLGTTRGAVAGLLYRAGRTQPTPRLQGIPKMRDPALKQPKPRQHRPTRILPRLVPQNNPIIAPVIRAQYRRAYADKPGEGMPFADAVLHGGCTFVMGDVCGTKTVACGCLRFRRGFCAVHYAQCFTKQRAETVAA